MTLREKLIVLRDKAGISQMSLAHQLGVSRQAVSRWESGQFYYDTVSDGKIDEKIEVSQHGYYTLTIENTSDFDVTINGYVNY